MHATVWFNGSFSDASSPGISAFSSAAQFGKGIFTTIRIERAAPFLWSKHWNRLTANAAAIGIDLSAFAEKNVANALEDLRSANGVESGRARLTFFDESAGDLWPHTRQKGTSLLIATADLRPAAEPFRIGISRFAVNSLSPLAGIKSCNYLEKILARNDADESGFDEAILQNERGEIASACMANLFWIRDGKLFTPALATGCVAGTTREFVLENLECEQVRVTVDELRGADDIFLTSAGIGVVQGAEFDGRTLEHSAHPIMQLLPSV